MPAPICAARRRVTLPARICCWTAALTRGRSDMKRISCVIACLLCAEIACAQSYPTRAVKVVVPWPPGQATDISARIVAQKLQEALSQPFVVDNRPGAGGSIGSDAVAKSPPDGYTLLASSSGPISITPHVHNSPYNPP